MINYYENIIFIIITDNTILQIPLSKSLRNSAQKVADEYGFSSLQELMRVLLTKLSKKELEITFQDPSFALSARNAIRYQKMTEDFEAKRSVKTFATVNKLMDDLHHADYQKPPISKKLPKKHPALAKP